MSCTAAAAVQDLVNTQQDASLGRRTDYVTRWASAYLSRGNALDYAQTVSYHWIRKQRQVDCLNVYSDLSIFRPHLPDSCLLVRFLKYPEVIFGDEGGAPSWAGWTQVGRAAHGGGESGARSGTLKGKGAGVCDEMRCEVFPHREPADA